MRQRPNPKGVNDHVKDQRDQFRDVSPIIARHGFVGFVFGMLFGIVICMLRAHDVTRGSMLTALTAL